MLVSGKDTKVGLNISTKIKDRGFGPLILTHQLRDTGYLLEREM
jgi:hypothetical protein